MAASKLELRTVGGEPWSVIADRAPESARKAPALSPVRLRHALVVSLLLLCGAIALGLDPPLWLQPTLVGILWGAIVLTGYSLAAAGDSGPLAKAFLVGLAIWLNDCCIQLTDLASAECLLLTTLLFGSGWIKRRLVDAGIDDCDSSFKRNLGWVAQWSIADLAAVTALIACVVHAATRLSPSPLLFSISWAYLVGLLYSWIAYRWVWQDRWSYSSLAVSLGGVIMAVSYVHRFAPVGFSWWHSFAWLCSGPLNVVAGQAMTVLLYFAIVRFESHSSPSPVR